MAVSRSRSARTSLLLYFRISSVISHLQLYHGCRDVLSNHGSLHHEVALWTLAELRVEVLHRSLHGELDADRHGDGVVQCREVYLAVTVGVSNSVRAVHLDVIVLSFASRH